MPMLRILTNVAKSNIPEDFLKDIGKEFTALIGKPEKFICVQIVPDQMMSFAGTTDPCALCYVSSIGKIGLEENKKYTTEITKRLKELGIAQDRMYITFSDIAREDCGWNNTTFAK